MAKKLQQRLDGGASASKLFLVNLGFFLITIWSTLSAPYPSFSLSLEAEAQL